MLLGSLMLIDSGSPALQISWAVIIPAVVVFAVLFTITVTVAVRVYREKPDTGKEGLINMRRKPKPTFMRTGRYLCAVNTGAPGAMRKRRESYVFAFEGLKLKVKKSVTRNLLKSFWTQIKLT